MFEDGKIPLIRTPIPLLQLITAGGIRFSTLVELWGPNRSGKTTTCYQAGGYFLEDFGDLARLVILDSESSVDAVRMEDSFGLDVNNDKRIDVVPAHFLEQGFLQVIDLSRNLKKDQYMMVIWDTLSASPTKSAYDTVLKQDGEEEKQEKKTSKKSSEKDKKKKDKTSMYGAGMGERQRVIKHFLRLVMSEIYGKNISLWMPNQVFANIGKGAPLIRGEGNTLQHDTHYSLQFKRLSMKVEEEEKLADNTISTVSLVKSKFSPEFDRCPIFMDNTKGGRIVEATSVMMLAVEMGLIQENKGYYRIDPNNKDEKGQRWASILEDEKLYSQVLYTITDRTRRKYPIVDKLYIMQGHKALVEVKEKKAKTIQPLASNLTEALKHAGYT